MDAKTQNIPPKSLDEVDLGVFNDTLSFFIRTLNRAVSRDLDEKLEGLDVAKGTGKISTLLLVNTYPGVRSSTIAQIIQRDRSAMGRLIDQMEAHDLLRREDSAEDGRAQELYITEKGAALAVTVEGIIQIQSRQFFSDLTDEEHEMVVRALRKVYRRMVGFKD